MCDAQRVNRKIQQKPYSIDDSIIYYIDTYIDGGFFSRSEPFMTKDTCLQTYNYIEPYYKKTNSSHGPIFEVKVQVSLNIKKLEAFQSYANANQTAKINIVTDADHNPKKRIIKRKSNTSSHSSRKTHDTHDLSDTSTVSCWRNSLGYVFPKNKSNTQFLNANNFINHVTFNPNFGKIGVYYLSFNKISQNQLKVIKTFQIEPPSYCNCVVVQTNC
jgi:hypothetical protein